MAWTACEPLSTLVLSGEPALVLSPDGGQLLWANPAGAQRLGADNLETLLSEEFPQDLPLRKQIRHLYGWLRSDREQVQRLRLGRSAATPLEMVTVSKLRNMDGVSGVLLRPATVPAASDFETRADLLPNWLGSRLQGHSAICAMPPKPFRPCWRMPQTVSRRCRNKSTSRAACAISSPR